MISNIQNKAASIESDILRWRRDLHKIPERSYDLPKTAAYLYNVLRNEIGIPDECIRTGVAQIGIVVDIAGEMGPGATVALRSDMDALEGNEDNDLPFKSQHPGFIHSCGHDGHMAMLLGTAKLLWSEKENFQGRARLIFEPAEEGPPPGGSYYMIKEGVMDGVDAIFACHLWPRPEYPFGATVFQKTVSMSALDCLTIKLKGKAGHGSAPQNGVDAITLAAEIINSMQYVITRYTDPMEILCLTIGTIHGGLAWNIIPEDIVMTGTMRSYNEEVRKNALERLERCVRTCCENAGATYEFINEPATDALINDERTSDLFEEVSLEMLGPEKTVVLTRPDSATDEFGRFATYAPGTYWRLNCCSGPETAFPPHSQQYMMDDSCLKTGTALEVGIVNKFLNERNGKL